MTTLNVRHTTVYRYRRPVRCGDPSADAASARQPRSSFDPNKFEFPASSVSTLDPRRVPQFDRDRIVREIGRRTADRKRAAAGNLCGGAISPCC
jgi:hypothetical protein